MTDPTTVEEIPWSDGSEPKEELRTSTPRKCKHPREERVRTTTYVDPQVGEAYEEKRETCGRCGHAFEASRQKRGRNARKRGKSLELRLARDLGIEPRGTSRDPEDAGGAADPVVVQAKSGPGFWPVRAVGELEKLATVAAGRPRMLVAIETPGPGRAARRVAVLYLDELQELTGLGEERKALVELREEVRKMLVNGDGSSGLEAALEEADRWKR